jgi:peptidoglycan biosynthesis protein MviN/MurJ (putative lipid II flippase)
VTIDNEPAIARRVFRIAVIAGGAVLGSLAGPAFASPPTTWRNPKSEGFLHYALVLGAIPLAVIVTITLLVYLPSMVKGRSSDRDDAFQDHPEWFGGPRRGVEATEESAPSDRSKQGGASARW